MDFLKIAVKDGRGKTKYATPTFKVMKCKDLMVRGKSFYAIWDEEAGLWSTDEYDVARLVDQEIDKFIIENKDKISGDLYPKYLSDYSTKMWKEFKEYISKISNSSTQLDEKITFLNSQVSRSDYISRRLPYNLEPSNIEAYDELISTLYDDEERQKIEWAIGSIISGDSKTIQKFIVLYGEAGSGKSTILNIIQKLFAGYYTIFEAKELTGRNNSFSTEAFKNNPLVGIQHDGDLSKIEDNTKLNSIVSHEEILINEKYKSSYPLNINCFLFMATNRPVKITDSRSGLIRRLIDVSPSGRRLPIKHYNKLYSQIDFELGGIANHCLEVYRELGKNFYNGYIPTEMMYKTDVVFNFLEENSGKYKNESGVRMSDIFLDFKSFCIDNGIEIRIPKYKLREEIKPYFESYENRKYVDGENVYGWFSGLKMEKFLKNRSIIDNNDDESWLKLNFKSSIFDEAEGDSKAQYAKEDETPKQPWSKVTTSLRDIDTKKLHYIRLPLNHIVIDFDLRDPKTGEKSAKLNMEAASKWPKTYAEFSKSGKGIHLHYFYEGDPTLLNSVYDEGIEIKVFRGNSALRRKLTKCNDYAISTISSGLPLKEVRRKSMVDAEVIKSEKGLRKLIERNLRKEIHPGTKPSIDFINKILDDAYNNGLFYDISDMRPSILAFANNSTNHSDYCVKVVSNMKFFSEESSIPVPSKSDEIIFFDIEVFPNLFVICYKAQGKNKKVISLINPSVKDVEKLLRYRLVGFNNRRYDNHVIYAKLLGYSNEKLFDISQKLINGSKNASFAEAYNLSYTDIYDFSSKKQSLKKFEIDLGIHHQELGMKWDEPVPEDKWKLVAQYCENDVIATEAVFNDRQADFIVRQVLADLSGLTVNHSNLSHIIKIIIGDDKNPPLVYTDLATGEQV